MQTQTENDMMLDKLTKVLRRAEEQELPAYLNHYQNTPSDFAPAAKDAVLAEMAARKEGGV